MSNSSESKALIAEAERLSAMLSAAAGELGAFVSQLRGLTKEVKQEREGGGDERS